MRKAIVAMLLTALVAVPAAMADKPAPKQKPIASEKTWVKLGGGKGLGTTLTLAQGLPITVTPLKPAVAVSSGVVRFPITQGKLIVTRDSNKAITGVRGAVSHVGGITIANGTKSVRVRNLIVVVDTTSKLTAQVNGKRIDLATLALGTPVVTATSVNVPVSAINLTAGAASALNAALGTALPSGASLGTAALAARIVGSGKE